MHVMCVWMDKRKGAVLRSKVGIKVFFKASWVGLFCVFFLVLLGFIGFSFFFLFLFYFKILILRRN